MNYIFFHHQSKKNTKSWGRASFYSQGTTISCLSKNTFYFGKNELNWNVMISAESEIDEMTTVGKKKSLWVPKIKKQWITWKFKSTTANVWVLLRSLRCCFWTLWAGHILSVFGYSTELSRIYRHSASNDTHYHYYF